MARHLAKQTRAAFIAEAQQKYTDSWQQLWAQKKELAAAGTPMHAQLSSMAGNSITRELDDAWIQYDEWKD